MLYQRDAKHRPQYFGVYRVDAGRITLRAGSIYTDRSGSEHSVTNVIVHDGFNRTGRVENDIALLQVCIDFTLMYKYILLYNTLHVIYTHWRLPLCHKPPSCSALPVVFDSRCHFVSHIMGSEVTLIYVHRLF